MPKATNRQSPSSPWYESVHDKDRVTEEPLRGKSHHGLEPSGAGDRFARSTKGALACSDPSNAGDISRPAEGVT